MANKNSFLLYADYQHNIELLTLEQRGILLTAIFSHVNRAEMPKMDAATSMAFSFIESQLNRDRDKWERIREKRAEAGREGGKVSGEVRKQTQANEANASFVKQNEANEAVNVTVSVNGNVNEREALPPAAHAPSSAPSGKPIRTSYGQYGWVKLTYEEYSRLLNDLGEQEVKRCIAYVDESAQTTGNKNKWRDWNLVLRKCSRDKWGVKLEPVEAGDYYADVL